MSTVHEDALPSVRPVDVRNLGAPNSGLRRSAASDCRRRGRVRPTRTRGLSGHAASSNPHRSPRYAFSSRPRAPRLGRQVRRPAGGIAADCEVRVDGHQGALLPASDDDNFVVVTPDESWMYRCRHRVPVPEPTAARRPRLSSSLRLTRRDVVADAQARPSFETRDTCYVAPPRPLGRSDEGEQSGV